VGATAKEVTLANEYEGVKDTARETANRVQDQASRFGQRAADAIDSKRQDAASGLESAAAGIHRTANSLPGGERVSGFAHQTADSLSNTAQYLRNHDVKDMASDMRRFVEDHPIPAVVGAALVGFLAGRAARR
jgi:ElaB/YqjD/DUF883 family membrane-anchored ribosome-binding protein